MPHQGTVRFCLQFRECGFKFPDEVMRAVDVIVVAQNLRINDQQDVNTGE